MTATRCDVGPLYVALPVKVETLHYEHIVVFVFAAHSLIFPVLLYVVCVYVCACHKGEEFCIVFCVSDLIEK